MSAALRNGCILTKKMFSLFASGYFLRIEKKLLANHGKQNCLKEENEHVSTIFFEI